MTTVCRNCRRELDEGHTRLDGTYVCKVSLWEPESSGPIPPDPNVPPPSGSAHQWDWTNPSQLFSLPTGAAGISITFVPDRTGNATGFVIDPASINPQFPQGYDVTIAISTRENDYGVPPPAMNSGRISNMRFQVGGQDLGYQPVLQLGQRYYFNARVNDPGQTPILRFQCYRPA